MLLRYFCVKVLLKICNRLYLDGFRSLILVAVLSGYATPIHAQKTRIKDLVNLKGVRSNQLLGYGLVIGLAGTGDSAGSISTNRSVANMLTRLGITANSQEIVSGSTAAVIASAELPPFARIGDKIDLRISTIGDAKSLAGGTLLLTPMRAGDGNVYVIGQGAVIVGQASGTGTGVLTVATVPTGGVVEKEFIPTLVSDGFVELSLKIPDFTTNSRITDEVNGKFKGFFAESLDPSRIKIEIPPQFDGKIVEFVSELENLTVQVDRKAVVVLNERTGTVVMGSGVMINPVTIAHGGLSITIGGKDSKRGNSKKASLMAVEGTTVGDLVSALNDLGVRPTDLIGILQAMYAAGALQAELKFM
ncbi:MAG: flagellar basal body P-ring protein FlgI [Bdellovibrionota bacterium]